jgi:hypothetical protein
MNTRTTILALTALSTLTLSALAPTSASAWGAHGNDGSSGHSVKSNTTNQSKAHASTSSKQTGHGRVFGRGVGNKAANSTFQRHFPSKMTSNGDTKPKGQANAFHRFAQQRFASKFGHNDVLGQNGKFANAKKFNGKQNLTADESKKIKDQITGLDGSIKAMEAQAQALKNTGNPVNQIQAAQFQAQADQLKAAKAGLEAQLKTAGTDGKTDPGTGKTDPGTAGKTDTADGKGKGGKDGMGHHHFPGGKIIVLGGHLGHGGLRHVYSGPTYAYNYRRSSYSAPAYAAAPAPVQTAVAPASCLSKEYLPNGPVLFKDSCANEWAMGDAAQQQSVNVACISKEYLQPGQVLFKDRCTGESAVNPPVDEQAQVQ